MVWSDEFDDAELDRTKWAPEISCWGGGNDERQCYTDRTENVDLVNGLLRLKALDEDFTGPLYPQERDNGQTASKSYTSGKVRTRGLSDWTYGRFAARIKMPAGQGTWPAFWMLSAEDFYGGWPLSGEIDVIETVNLGAFCEDCPDLEENRLHGTIHFGNEWPANERFGETYTLPGGTRPDESYHVYAIEWGEGRFDWYVDDVYQFSATTDNWFTISPQAQGDPNAPFDRPFYMMLNLAVGGSWPENVNELGLDANSIPNQLLVDWVRVYECEPDPQTGLACMRDLSGN